MDRTGKMQHSVDFDQIRRIYADEGLQLPDTMERDGAVYNRMHMRRNSVRRKQSCDPPDIPDYGQSQKFCYTCDDYVLPLHLPFDNPEYNRIFYNMY